MRNWKYREQIRNLNHLRGCIRSRTVGGAVGEAASGSRSGTGGSVTAPGAGSGLLVGLDDVVEGHVQSGRHFCRDRCRNPNELERGERREKGSIDWGGGAMNRHEFKRFGFTIIRSHFKEK